MKHEHKHFLARLVVSSFLLLGFGFWTSHFVVDAANWTVGSISRNNTNFLSGAFWDNSPSSGDIIKALYGSGDEGTVYTQNWTGYTSGSCLSGGISVVTTGVLPTVLSANTIYVLASGSYDITTGITMNDCSALISSGIVTLSGNVGASGTIIASEKNNFIIEKIRVGNNSTDGISISSGMNFSLNEIKTFNNTGNGLSIENSSQGMVRNIESSENIGIGIELFATTNMVFTTINTTNNQHGIWAFMSSGNIFSGVIARGNSLGGISLVNTSETSLSNALVYDNEGKGVVLSFSHHNILDTIDSHNNTESNIYLDTTSNNTLTNIVANGSQNAMGINIFASSGNILSGVTADGNYYAGVHLYNSNNNTGTNITANSNEGGLYVEHSTGNVFNNITVTNSTKNGVALFWLNNTILSGLVSSGNMNGGIYMSNSDDNILYNIKSSNNNRVGLLIAAGNNNIIERSIISNNTNNGIQFSYGSGNTVDTSIISLNNNHGLGLDHSQGNHILNSTIDVNGYNGINIYYSNNIIVSGCNLSGNMSVGIQLDSSNNSIIQNTHYYFGGPETWKYSIFIANSTGTSISQFSGNKDIYEYQQNGIFNYTVHDSYTKSHNYIRLYSYNSATLTGNTLAVGSTFVPYFNELKTIGAFDNYLNVLGVNSFTVGGATWDGILYIPTAITTGAKLASTGEVGTTNIAKILDTIEVVSGSTHLIMNGGTGIIDFYVASGTSGQHLSILKSIDGTTWATNALTSGCTLDENLVCTFSFTGTFKLFAFGVPTNYSFTGTTQLGTIVTSGGLYNTGVRITFTGENLSGATLNGATYTSGTLITSDGVKTFVLSDIGGNTTGITFTIDRTAPAIIGTNPTNGLNYTGGNTMTFIWSGTDVNMSGYTLYINNTGYSMGTLTGYTTGLINGAYTWYVVARDRAGNIGTSPIYPFSISTPFSGDISITGTTLIGSQRFTNSAVGIYMRANEPVTYSITGNVANAPVTGTIIAQQGRKIHYPMLTGTDGSKDIYVTITNASGVSISKTFLAQLDTVAPAPTLVSPTSGATTVNSPTLSWAMNSPDPAHISGYQYFVSPTPAFGTIIASGTTTATSAAINLSSLGLFSTPLYRYVKAIDSLGNSGVSVVQPFYYSGTLDTTPDSFAFSSITDARINRIYASTTITLTGLSPNTAVLATASKGALYISGNFVGTTGYIQNGWTLKVELSSSAEYASYVTSTVTVGDSSATFRVTTMTENNNNNNNTDDYSDISTTLSSTEKLQIIAIFETLRDLYNGDKQEEFFNSLLVMLESKIDDLGSTTNDNNKREALEYLYDLADQYGDGNTDNTSTDISSTSWIKNGIYTAPNGKKYTIRYDSDKKQFTSTNFLTPKYFPTLDVLKYTIDIANPIGSQYANAKIIKARRGRISIDGTWQTSAYTAPNRKVFYFFKTMEGKYSSYTFTVEKYFDSLDAVKEYIYTNNRK